MSEACKTLRPRGSTTVCTERPPPRRCQRCRSPIRRPTTSRGSSNPGGHDPTKIHSVAQSTFRSISVEKLTKKGMQSNEPDDSLFNMSQVKR